MWSMIARTYCPLYGGFGPAPALRTRDYEAPRNVFVNAKLSTVPRFFFSVIEPGGVAVDDIGLELPDKSAAWDEAIMSASDALRDIDRGFQPGQEVSVHVSDEVHKKVYIIKVSSELVGDD
jgi:hypothetical protein